MVPPVKFVHGETRRACANCATAKTKCVSSNNDAGTNSCDRCHLLKKTCVLQPETRRRKRRTAHAVLAEKVDEIVALLTKPDSTNPGDTIQREHPDTPNINPNQPPLLDTKPFFSIQGVTVGADEATELLDHFRQHQSHHAPFISLPPSTTASRLRDSNPLLFIAIITSVTHHDPHRQESLLKVSMAVLAEQVLVQGKRSLGLLQGILVLLNWFHNQIYINGQITNLLHLGMAMVVDLGYTQNSAPVMGKKGTAGMLLEASSRSRERGREGLGLGAVVRRVEDWRGLLGGYWLSCAVASSFTVSVGLGWSVQMEEGCGVLEGSGREGDGRLVGLVRLTRIGEEIGLMKRDVADGHGLVAPLGVYVAPFEDKLRGVWEGMGEDVRGDALIQLSHQTVKMNLYALSLLPTTPASTTQSSLHNTSSINTTRYQCLNSALSAIDIFLSLPATNLYHLPLPFFAQTGHVLTTLARLRASTPPLAFNLRHLLERVASHLDLASTPACGMRHEPSPGKNPERMSRWAAWLRRCARAVGDGEQEEQTGYVEDAVVGGGSGYMTPMSGFEGGGVLDGDGTDLTGGFGVDYDMSMDWTTLLGDMSGVGMFGIADDMLFQDILAGNGGSSGAVS